MTDVANYEPVLEMVIGMFVIMFDMLIAGLYFCEEHEYERRNSIFLFYFILSFKKSFQQRSAGQVIQRMSTNDCTLDTLLALLCHTVHEEMTNV